MEFPRPQPGIYLLLIINDSDPISFSPKDYKVSAQKFNPSNNQNNYIYNILYLIRIWDISQNVKSNVLLSFIYRGQKYWRMKECLIEDITNAQRNFCFKFKIAFKNLDKGKIIPSEDQKISLAEEITLFKKILSENNQWSKLTAFYFAVDLIEYMKKQNQLNQKIEIDVILFIFKQIYDSDLNYLDSIINDLLKDIKSIQLKPTMTIDEITDSQIIVNMFDTILGFQNNKYQNKFREIFVLYLMKYEPCKLIKFISKYNINENDGTKSLLNILSENKNFEIFSSFEISDTIIKLLVIRSCQSENEFRGIIKFVKTLDLLIEIVQKNTYKIKQIDSLLQKPINLTFKVTCNEEKGVKTFINNISLFYQKNFQKIHIHQRVLQKAILNLVYLKNILKVIIENDMIINSISFQFIIQKNINNQIILIGNDQNDLKEILYYCNQIVYKKEKLNILKNIKIDIPFIYDSIKECLSKGGLLAFGEVLENYEKNYQYLNKYIEKKELCEILHNKIVQIIHEGSLTTIELLNVLSKDKGNEKKYPQYIPQISKLISFKNIESPFPLMFRIVITKIFAEKRKSLLDAILDNSIQNINELVNFLNVLGKIRKEIDLQLFTGIKNKFCLLIEQTENKNINLIKQFFRILFNFSKLNLDLLKEILQKAQICFEDNFSQVLYDIQQSEKNIDESTKKEILEMLILDINNYSLEENIEIIKKYLNDEDILKKIFLEKNNWIMEENDFYTISNNFKFYTLLVDMNLFNSQSKLLNEFFFKESIKTIELIRGQIENNNYDLKCVNSLQHMLDNQTLKKNILYIYCNKKPNNFDNVIETLTSIINKFTHYRKAINNIETFNNYFYQNSQQHSQLKNILENNKINEILNKYSGELNKINSLNVEALKYIEVIGSKFFDIIYKQQKSLNNDEQTKREEAIRNFDKLRYLLDIKKFQTIQTQVIEDIVFFCKQEEIKNEFMFLKKYFKDAHKDKPEEVMRKIISKSYKRIIKKHITTIIFLCTEYKVIESDFILQLKEYEQLLKNSKITTEDIENIEYILSKQGFDIHDKSNEYNKVINTMYEKNAFFDFIKNKTRNSVISLNEFIGDLDDSYLSPDDISKLESVVGFWEDLRIYENKHDHIFIEKFKNLANERKIANNFLLVLDKFSSFKDLYDNVSNKNEFAKEKINQILLLSTIKIQHSENNFGDVDCIISYSKGKTMSENDLYELKVKAQMKSKTQQKEEDTRKTKNFSKYVQQIEILLSTVRKLVTIGDSTTYQYKIMITNSEMRLTTGNIQSVEKPGLENEIEKLKQKLNTIKTIQEQKYKNENNVLITFIYGKAIYQLTNFFRTHKGLDSLESLLKYITKNTYKRSAVETIMQSNLIIDTDNIEEVLGHNKTFLRELLKQGGLSEDKLFQENLIKPNKLNNSKGGIYTSLIENKNKFEETIMKIYLRYTGHLPIPQTFLLCNQNTTLEEITAFIYRALYYPKAVLFGIVQTELLHLTVRERIITILEHENKDKNRKQQSFLVFFYFDQSLDLKIRMQQKQIDTIFNQLNDNDVDVKTYLKNISIIYSTASGLGKSFQIKSEIQKANKQYEHFPVGGVFCRENIIKRLHKINFKPGKTVIHLDLHETKDNNLMKDFLFSFLILRSYFDNNLIFYLDSSIEIKIELPCGFIDYFKKFPLLTLIPNKTKIEKFDFNKYVIPENTKSDEQIVGYVLKFYADENKINTLINLDIPQPLSKKECVSYIQKYFSKENPTFYQTKIFISVLAEQFRLFTNNIYLKPSELQLQQEIRPRLNHIRKKIISSLIQLTKYFTEGAYSQLLEKQRVSYNMNTNVKYDTEKEEAKAIQILSQTQPILFKDIKINLLTFNMDGASLSIISKIKSNTTNPQEKEEYEMYLDLIQCQSPNDVPKLNDYETFTNEQFIKEIIKNLNISKKTFKKSKEFDLIPENLKELPKFIETYITDSYVFTFDNYIKLMLIMIRFRANIPVILMGETGCGKTFLVRTISKLLGIDIKILNIHAGVLENDIINFLERYNLFEDQNIKISKTWVFLDEINTCDVLGLISEIMIKHSANGRSITKDAFFIGACNPYRVKTTNKDILYGITTSKKENQIKLVYTVNVLPHSLLNYVTDFGSLNEEDELKYINSMIQKPIINKCKEKKISSNTIGIHLQYAEKGIHFCQNYLKKENDISTVSLREVRRFNIFYEWFFSYLLIKIEDEKFHQNQQSTYKTLYEEVKKKGKYDNISKYSIILAIYVCYYLRCPLDLQREEMNKQLSKIFGCSGCSFTEFPIEESNDIAERVQVSNGIAFNRAFLDNLYGLFVCVNSKVPVIICGKPGCSKSLSMNILISSMKGENSENYLFKKLPRLYVTYFQGAKTTTSEGVSNAFQRARNLLRKNKNQNIISLLFFDEMGLAEISSNNPLKVIHSNLEYDENDDKIAFVGISNWTLDASKMNRCVFLAILEPNEDDLKKTANKIANSFRNGLGDSHEYHNLFQGLASLYYQYKIYLKDQRRIYYDYHGLRDFYNLIKCACLIILSNKVSQIDQIEKMSIERNLAGIPDSVKQCNSVKQCKEILNKIKSHNEIIAKNYPVSQRIEENLENYESRFLLILSDSSNIQFLIESLIKKKEKEYAFYNGSLFEEDSNSQVYAIRTLTKMKKATEEGIVLCLSNLDYLYPSFYDVFNQNYIIRDGKKYAKIALESDLTTNTNIQTYVNDSFRVIIFLKKQCLDSNESLPEIPFLNRFEKHIVSYEDLVEKENITGNKESEFKKLFKNFLDIFDKLIKLQKDIKHEDVMLHPEKINIKIRKDNTIKEQTVPGFLINCSKEEIKGIIYQLHEQNKDIELQTLEMKILEKLVRVFPQDLLAFINISEFHNNEASKQYVYSCYKKLNNTNSSLRKYLENTNYQKSIIYTFTHFIAPLTNFSFISKLEQSQFYINESTIKQIQINSIKSETELEQSLIDYFMDTKQNVCILKFSISDCIHLNSVRSLVDNLQKEKHSEFPQNYPKKILLIVYLKKYLNGTEFTDDNEYESLKHIEFISQIAPGYDQITIDNLFSEIEDINLGNYLSMKNEELFSLKPNSLFNVNEIIKEVLPECLNKLKYNVRKFPNNIKNIDEYKEQVISKLQNDTELIEKIQEIMAKEVKGMESFVKSVFYKEKNAFTIYYVSFLEVFKNYLKRNFIELLIKILVVFERNGVIHTKYFAEENNNEELNAINKKIFNDICKNINLSSINVNFETNSNEVDLIFGIKIIQSLNKFEAIKKAIKNKILDYTILQNQKRKNNDEINLEQKNNILKVITDELQKVFGEGYLNYQNVIYNDYLVFYLLSNNINEINICIELIQIYFEIQKTTKLNEKIFCLEVDEEYIINICYMYSEFVENSSIPFINKIKKEVKILIANEKQIIPENKAIFALSEALFKTLLNDATLVSNINKLKSVVQIMKYLNCSLFLNTKYLHECEIIINISDYFPATFETHIKEYMRLCNPKNNNYLNKKLKFLKDKCVKKGLEYLTLNILIFEYKKKKEEDSITSEIISTVLADIKLVLICKRFLYLILSNTNEDFELKTKLSKEEFNNNNETLFEKANHQNSKRVFTLLKDSNINNKDKIEFIIEDHFLFIFETISKKFFEKNIQEKLEEEDVNDDEMEKIRKTVSVVQKRNFNDNDDENEIAYFYFTKALSHIETYITNNNQQPNAENKITFLYSVAYLKVYLEYLVNFSINYAEFLSNISPIINNLMTFGGDEHKSFKQSMYFYILKLFDNHYGLFQMFYTSTLNSNQFKPVIELFDSENKNNEFEEISNEHELDFPFIDNKEIYLELRNEFADQDEKNNDSIIQLINTNQFEFINYLLNSIFAFSLAYYKKQEFFTELNLPFYEQCIQTCFNKQNDVKNCLRLFIQCDSRNKTNQFYEDIKHLSQREYTKVLLCFKLVIIIALKGNGNIKSLYLKLGKELDSETQLTNDFEMKVLIYLSLSFFGRYLECFDIQEKQHLKTETPRQTLRNIFTWFQELENTIEYPIEIFFHCFYQHYYKTNFDIKSSLQTTKNTLFSFTETYEKHRKNISHIKKENIKSIVREVYDPLTYSNLPYLKYFLLSNIMCINKHKQLLNESQRLESYPLFHYLYDQTQLNEISYLNLLKKLNPFGKDILNEYNNKYLKNEIEKKTIESFILKNSDEREKSFKKFQKAFNNLKTVFTPPNVTTPTPDLDQSDVHLLYCLPGKLPNDKGYHYTYILQQLIKIQNKVIKRMLHYLRGTSHTWGIQYLSSQISKSINIQDADDSDIFTLLTKKNNCFDIMQNTFELYCDRDCFNNNGSFNHRRYGNIIIDDIKIHEELMVKLLQGKRLFNNNIKYISFKSQDEKNIIQDDLNKKQQEKTSLTKQKSMKRLI